MRFRIPFKPEAVQMLLSRLPTWIIDDIHFIIGAQYAAMADYVD